MQAACILLAYTVIPYTKPMQAACILPAYTVNPYTKSMQAACIPPAYTVNPHTKPMQTACILQCFCSPHDLGHCLIFLKKRPEILKIFRTILY